MTPLVWTSEVWNLSCRTNQHVFAQSRAAKRLKNRRSEGLRFNGFGRSAPQSHEFGFTLNIYFRETKFSACSLHVLRTSRNLASEAPENSPSLLPLRMQ